MFPEWALQESEGSKTGVNFIGAGGERVRNRGQRRGKLLFESGKTGPTTLQDADVRKPLIAVSETCDENNICLFSNTGSMVASLRDPIVQKIVALSKQVQDKIDVHREKGTYHIPAWVVGERKIGDGRGSPFRGQQ